MICPLGLKFLEYLWGLSPSLGLSVAHWQRMSPSALTAWLTTEPVYSRQHPNRVLLASSATTALEIPEYWRELPPPLVAMIEAAKAKWPLNTDTWAAAGFCDDADWPFLSKVLTHGVPMCPLDTIPARYSLKNYASF